MPPSPCIGASSTAAAAPRRRSRQRDGAVAGKEVEHLVARVVPEREALGPDVVAAEPEQPERLDECRVEVLRVQVAHRGSICLERLTDLLANAHSLPARAEAVPFRGAPGKSLRRCERRLGVDVVKSADPGSTSEINRRARDFPVLAARPGGRLLSRGLPPCTVFHGRAATPLRTVLARPRWGFDRRSDRRPARPPRS